MKIAYVGDFHNHGQTVSTTGTPIVYLLAKSKRVESIDVFCPTENVVLEKTYIPSNVTVIPKYKKNKPLSVLNLYNVEWKKYDDVIFNLLPTVFGKSSIINLIGLTIPYVLTKLGHKSIKLIYHNSTLTNDVKKLGYNSNFDKIRTILLSLVEEKIFSTVQTYVPLELYVRRIKDEVKDAKVQFLDMRYLEGITTIFLNHAEKKKFIKGKDYKNGKKRVLLHGYWGPQKNLEIALRTLKKLRAVGIDFHLTLSGCVNDNFKKYESHFNHLLDEYATTIDERILRVKETEIMGLFSNTYCVIIPYNTPGGHSGVLETASAFDCKIVCLKHDEFVEQGRFKDNFHIVEEDLFEVEIMNVLTDISARNNGREISIAEKVEETMNIIESTLL